MSEESQAHLCSTETRHFCCLITTDLVAYIHCCLPYSAWDNESISSDIPVLLLAPVWEDNFSILEISIQNLTLTQNSNKQKQFFQMSFFLMLHDYLASLMPFCCQVPGVEWNNNANHYTKSRDNVCNIYAFFISSSEFIVQHPDSLYFCGKRVLYCIVLCTLYWVVIVFHYIFLSEFHIKRFHVLCSLNLATNTTVPCC